MNFIWYVLRCGCLFSMRAFLLLLVFLNVIFCKTEEASCEECRRVPIALNMPTIQTASLSTTFLLAISEQSHIFTFGAQYPPSAAGALYMMPGKKMTNFSAMVQLSSPSMELRNFFGYHFLQVWATPTYCGLLAIEHTLLLWNETNWKFFTNMHSMSVSPMGVFLLDQTGNLLLNERLFDTGVTSIAGHYYGDVLLLIKNKLLHSYGSSTFGLLGLGDEITSVIKPTLINAPPVTKISISETHALIVAENGYIYGFGSNEYNQLSTKNVSTSTPIMLSVPFLAHEVKACQDMSMVVSKYYYSLITAGSNRYKLLAHDDTSIGKYTQTQSFFSFVDCSNTTAIGIQANNDFNMYADASLFVWGNVSDFYIPKEIQLRPTDKVLIGCIITMHLLFSLVALLSMIGATPPLSKDFCSLKLAYIFYVILHIIISAYAGVFIVLSFVIVGHAADGLRNALWYVMGVYLSTRALKLVLGMQLFWYPLCQKCKYREGSSWSMLSTIAFKAMVTILYNGIIDVVFVLYSTVLGLTDMMITKLSQSQISAIAQLAETNLSFLVCIAMLIVYFVHLLLATGSLLLVRRLVMVHSDQQAERHQHLVDEVTLKLLYDNELTKEYGTKSNSSVQFDVNLFEIKVNELSQFAEIGNGAAGVVMRAKWKNQTVAVKFFRRKFMEQDNDLEQFTNEGTIVLFSHSYSFTIMLFAPPEHCYCVWGTHGTTKVWVCDGILLARHINRIDCQKISRTNMGAQNCSH